MKKSRQIEIYEELKSLKNNIIEMIKINEINEGQYDGSDLHNAINDYKDKYEDLFDEVQIPIGGGKYVQEMEDCAEYLFNELNILEIDPEDDEKLNQEDIDFLKDSFEELEEGIGRIVR